MGQLRSDRNRLFDAAAGGEEKNLVTQGYGAVEIRLTGWPDFQWFLEIRLTDSAVPISNTTARTVESL